MEVVAGDTEEFTFVSLAEIMNQSPTVSCDFENFYLHARAKESEYAESNGDTENETRTRIEASTDGLQISDLRLFAGSTKSLESKPKIPREIVLRLVDGRLQSVGFSSSEPKRKNWRNIVDSIFR
jgi:hypothetical protein